MTWKFSLHFECYYVSIKQTTSYHKPPPPYDQWLAQMNNLTCVWLKKKLKWGRIWPLATNEDIAWKDLELKVESEPRVATVPEKAKDKRQKGFHSILLPSLNVGSGIEFL